jgi:GNAT superfamily N-acetyltransferase
LPAIRSIAALARTAFADDDGAMTAHLRQALAADIPALWRVRYAVTENTLAPGRLSDEDVRRELEDTGRGWLIEDDGQVVAFAIANARSGNVWALFVHPAHQGRGHGSRLHAAMLAWLRAVAAPCPWLDTGAATRARAFYAREGWVAEAILSSGEIRYRRPDWPDSLGAPSTGP